MNVIGMLGLPGAGKTTACETIENRVDHSFETISMKSVAKSCYDSVEEHGIDGFTDSFQDQLDSSEYDRDEFLVTGDFGNEILEWVNIVLDVEEDYFASRACERAKESEAEVSVVDGIRSTADAEAFSTEADNCVFYFLHCPFGIRLNRLQSRNRAGEEGMTAQELLNRDETELSWGLQEILSAYTYDSDRETVHFVQDYPIKYIPAMNHDSIGDFQSEIDFHVSDTINQWNID